MSEKELRELDAWIAEHVMSWTDIHDNKYGVPKSGKTPPDFHTQSDDYIIPQFHYDPAASMEVLKKCGEKQGVTISIAFCEGDWCVWHPYHLSISKQHSTLELAICLFAKKLFTPQAKRE